MVIVPQLPSRQRRYFSRRLDGAGEGERKREWMALAGNDDQFRKGLARRGLYNVRWRTVAVDRETGGKIAHAGAPVRFRVGGSRPMVGGATGNRRDQRSEKSATTPSFEDRQR